MCYELRCLGSYIYSSESLDELEKQAVDFDAECEHTHEIVLVIKSDSREEEVSAEWSRIQQALKERDELEIERDKYKTARDGWYKSAIGYLKDRNALEAERDELAADLERIKAERDSALESADIQCNIRYMQTEELESLKSRLPVSADGDNVFIGDEVWVHGYHVFAFEIVGIRWASHDRSKGYEVKEKGSDLNGWWPLSACHSTAESCRAAN